MHELRGSSVLVVGATGFVASRLVQTLVAQGARVKALVRRHFAPLPGDSIERIVGDVTDATGLRTAMHGCDFVVNCAWGGDTLADARRINVQGAVNVANAAGANGIKRLVHLSTMAVHGSALPEVLTEDAPLVTRGDVYSVTKAEGEAATLRAAQSAGVECVALRPTIVYGPNAPIWLVAYFQRVRRGEVALIDDGDGMANLVYVDDLVAAIIAALSRPKVAGNAYLISGQSPIPWRSYLGAFARLARVVSPPSISRRRAQLELVLGKALEIGLGRPRRVYAMDLSLMTQHCAVSIDKAMRELGYRPTVDFEDGVSRCAAWLEDRGYLPRRVTRPSFGAATR